jgi:DNA-binding MarR family transcriptional regulator
MGTILQQRLGTNHRFTGGEEVMLALSVALSDLGATPARILGEHSLTHTQYNVLRMLRGAGQAGLAHSEITGRLILGMPDITRLMDALVRRRLVRRGRSSVDRRRVIHRLTPEGGELLVLIDGPMGQFHDWVASGLSDRRRAAFVKTCEQLIEMAVAANDREGDQQ